MKLSIYFAGTIAKNHEVIDSMWTEEDFAQLRKTLRPHELNLLNPAYRTDDLCDNKSIFGRDMTQVFLADLIFVDARHRRGLGVGMGMRSMPLSLFSDPHLGSIRLYTMLERLNNPIWRWSALVVRREKREQTI